MVGNYMYANRVNIAANSSEVLLTFSTITPVLDESGEISGETAIHQQQIVMSPETFAGFLTESQRIAERLSQNEAR